MPANFPLIDADELHGRLGLPGLSVVDASWYLPAQQRDARAEFEKAHIPGAVFFDQDAVVDPASSMPHAISSAEIFGKAAGVLGIRQTDTIVVYEAGGLMSAARVWWLFRTFGASDVRVLDGGLPAWTEKGFALDSGGGRRTPAVFVARRDDEAFVLLDEMRAIVAGGRTQIADARSAERFRGEAPEPRAGVRRGHMPGATSVPFTDLVREGRLKSPAEIETTLKAAGIDPERPVVTSCGSGITAAVINLALASLGKDGARLYDGSWTEWGSTEDTPVETGAAR